MNTLNFNDADLKANREGRLSDAQMKRLEAETDPNRPQSKFMLRVLIGLSILLAISIACAISSEHEWFGIYSARGRLHLTGCAAGLWLPLEIA
jgi:hypothetical protein